ncbi:MFS transporter [Chelonobacter oris]|uniref:Major facilitator transporter n=1 Tax=Chelonobacter oris TaxID=505317 RepID=A0A0A3ASV9_9PAST|nr:MFS transporter [Chelonobacter oris]KGQ70847.1 major facilitator transporter [Chelonobacter oris]MDH2999332.1 MFS transporter [Chelonobacter oris]
MNNSVKLPAFIVPRLSLMMFMEFFIWGSWSVTLGIVMTKYDLSTLIGDAFSMGPIASIISPFILGMLVDRFFPSEKVLAILHLIGAAILWFIPDLLVAGQGSALVSALLAYMLCYMPTVALTNNIAFHNLVNSEKSFPIIRVFGTIGWIVAGLFIGQADLSGSPLIFQVAAICSLLLGIYSLTLPNTPAPAKGQPFSMRDLMCVDAFALFKIRHFLIFAICATLISIPLGTYYAYAAPFLDAVGFEKIGSLMSMGQMSEIVFMLLIPFFFKRLGVKYMLLAGMLAWFLRYVLFALGVNEDMRWAIYLGILLHGICYDFFFVVGFIYTDKVANERVRAQAQSLVVLFTYGIGMLLGSQISGGLFNRMFANQAVTEMSIWRTFWWIPAISAVVIAVIFFVFFNYKDKEGE